jgi:hypothetical protein
LAEAGGTAGNGDADGDDEWLQQHYEGLDDHEEQVGETPPDNGSVDERTTGPPIAGPSDTNGTSQKRSREDDSDDDDEDVQMSHPVEVQAANAVTNGAGGPTMVMGEYSGAGRISLGIMQHIMQADKSSGRSRQADRRCYRRGSRDDDSSRVRSECHLQTDTACHNW